MNIFVLFIVDININLYTMTIQQSMSNVLVWLNCYENKKNWWLYYIVPGSWSAYLKLFSLIWNYAIACHKTTHEPCGKGVNGFSFGHYISWNLHYNINFLPYCQGLVFSNFVIGDLNNLCKDFYFWIAYASITKKKSSDTNL